MAKFNDIRELAQQNARWVSNSPKDWMNYLDVAARLYRYSFKDTLLIHAQRPDATACAELEVWNKKMNRWVNRGAKGIALLDDASPRAKLRYVFDIADTHLVQGGRTPILWRIDDSEHQQMILDHLADTYALTQTDSMNAALMELAQQLTAENLEEAMDGLEYEVTDTFLEGLDEDAGFFVIWSTGYKIRFPNRTRLLSALLPSGSEFPVRFHCSPRADGEFRNLRLKSSASNYLPANHQSIRQEHWQYQPRHQDLGV